MSCSSGMHEDEMGNRSCDGECDYYEDGQCVCCSLKTDELTAYAGHLLCGGCLKEAKVEDAKPPVDCGWGEEETATNVEPFTWERAVAVMKGGGRG